MAESDVHVDRPAALAVVVSAGLTDYLPETLRGIAEQRQVPAAVLLVDITPVADPGHARASALRAAAKASGLSLESVRIAQAPTASTFGAAVRDGLAQLTDQAGGPGLVRAPWLWLLHDDSAPEPRALGELLRTAESGRSIAIVGSKQRDWVVPDELLEVGVTVSPGGRRFTGIEDGELDQGQHDGRDDVYAVGTAGALVDRDVWESLGGTDPVLGPFGDGLDLSRRARLAGYRVVVAPDAVVRHARASYLGLRPAPPKGAGAAAGPAARPEADPRRSFRARRAALLHLRLVEAAAWTLPFLTIAVVLGALVRSLARVVTKEPGLAGDELQAAVSVLFRPGSVHRARRRARSTQRISARQLRPLRADWREVWRVGHDRRLHAAVARRTRRAPSPLEIAERAALARRRRTAGTLVALLLIAVAAVAFGPLLVGGPLTGGALLPLDADLGDLWRAATSSWVATADGYPGPPDPLLAVLAVLSFPAGGSGQATVSALVLASIPLAGAGAWYASGAATRSAGLRAWATAVWALTPALLLATGQGRLGAVVAHIALPWAALGVARALGVQRRDVLDGGSSPVEARADGATADGADAAHPGVPAGAEAAPGARQGGAPARALDSASTTAPGSPGAAAAAGLALALAAAGAPVLLPAGLLALVLLALEVRDRRRYLLLVAVPPLALLAPLVVEAARNVASGTWRVLVADPGVPLASSPGEAYFPLLTWPTEPLPWPLLPEPAASVAPLVAGGVLAVAALLAFVRTRRLRAVQAGWLVAVAGLVAALGASRVDVATGRGLGAESAVQVVRGWAGAGTSLVLLGLLVAVVAAGDGLRARLADYPFGWRQVGASVLTILLVLGPVTSAVAWGRDLEQARATAGTDQVLALTARATAPVPAIGVELQRPPTRASVLALAPVDGELAVRLWRDQGDQLDEQSTSAAARVLTGLPGATEIVGPDAADTALAALAAALAAGSAGDPRGALAAHAVGVVVVPPGEGEAREDLVGRLNGTLGLERVTENASGVVWRVAPPEGAAATGRVDVVTAEGVPVQVVPAEPVGGQGPVDPGDAGRVLVSAERADESWQAWLDGRPLGVTATDWRQAFVVGEAGGTVVVTNSDWTLTLVHTVQAVVLGLFVLLSLPLRRRRPGAV